MAHQNSLPYGHRYTPNTADFFKWSRNLLSLIKYMSPAKKFCPQRCTARSSKCHPGMEPDKVTPTFFPMQDYSKVLSSVIWFSYPGNSKKYFHGNGGLDGAQAPEVFLAYVRAKRGYFQPIFHKILCF